ncbi:Golgin sub A member 1 [Saguinus oedipus]|uniref:Golgin sub A member 1 n=1 Tax=Saguinus oedipus TaxID=9490 RepID=A0ABQ9WFB7_SAGOE|nr:Golgin sub A member 1 [Saguinus oedipus]
MLQAANLTAILEEKEHNLQEKTEALLQKEQEILQLERGHNSALLQMHQLQAELEALRTLRAEEAAAATEPEDLLRLRGPLREEVLSVSEPQQDAGQVLRASPEEAAVGDTVDRTLPCM